MIIHHIGSAVYKGELEKKQIGPVEMLKMERVRVICEANPKRCSSYFIMNHIPCGVRTTTTAITREKIYKNGVFDVEETK